MTRPARTLLSPLAACFAASLLLNTLAAQDPVLRIIAMPTRSEMEAQSGTAEGLSVDEAFYGQWSFLRERALKEGVTILVFELTTPGGRLDICERVIDDLAKLREQGIRTVAYIPDSAMSAGALIALGTQELVLAPAARMGNAIPISFSGLGRLTQDVPEKVMSSITGLGERLAAGGRFDRTLILAMIDPDLAVYSVRGLGGGDPVIQTAEELARNYPRERLDREGQTVREIVPRGQAFVLAADAERDRLLLGSRFPYLVANTRGDLPRILGLGDRAPSEAEVLRMEAPRPFAEGLRRAFGSLSWSWVLAFLGILFFILELKTPGLGIAGVLSILCLIGFFTLEADAGTSPWLPIALLLLGALLLFAEIFLFPGFGLAGVSGIVLVIGSIYAATIDLPGESWTERLVPDSTADWAQAKGWLLGFVLAFAGSGIVSLALARNLDRLPFLKRAFIKPPVLEPIVGTMLPTAVTGIGTIKLGPGELGRASTELRPSGFARFGDREVDVVSEGGWIPRGAAVRVLKVEGPRVIVAKVEAEQP